MSWAVFEVLVDKFARLGMWTTNSSTGICGCELTLVFSTEPLLLIWSGDSMDCSIKNIVGALCGLVGRI